MDINHILHVNAIESWNMARKYCLDILDGRITLLYRKYFVSSLHNAVELFVKQIMLNNNDYRVIKNTDFSETGEPVKSFLNSVNLNVYFANLDKDNLRKFRTIEFSQIIDLHRKILKPYFELNPNVSITEELRTLNRLRNDEAHFYIELQAFLSDNEFLQLHNFMRTFYEILRDLGIAPSAWDIYFDKIERFTYKGVLKDSPFVKDLSKYFNGYNLSQDSATAFAIALLIYSDEKMDEMDEMDEDYQIRPEKLDVLHTYIEALIEYDMLEIVTTATGAHTLRFNMT